MDWDGKGILGRVSGERQGDGYDVQKGKEIGNKKGILRSISVNSVLFQVSKNSANKDSEWLLNDFLAERLCSIDYDIALKLNNEDHSLNSYT